MTGVRLLATSNFPRPALLALRPTGVEVESVAERRPRASDAAVRAHAAAAGARLPRAVGRRSQQPHSSRCLGGHSIDP